MTTPMSLPIVAIFFSRVCITSVNGELIDRPQDAYVLLNNSTYFNCSTTIRRDNIHWYHYRVGEDKINYVYYKGEVNKQYGSRYTMERNTQTGVCNLQIASVEPQDAGKYVCQDDAGLGTSASAQLIVLETSPTCLSNTTPDGITGPNSCGLQTADDIQLSCSLSYHGNIPPLLEWVKFNGSDVPFDNTTTVDNRGNRVIVNMTLKADASLDRSYFLCRRKQTRSTEYECNTGHVKVNYAFGYTPVMNVTLDDEVNCSANTNQVCQYRWFHGNDSFCPVACNRKLKVTKLGIHKCEAKCQINGTDCTFWARTIQVFEKTFPAETTEKVVVVTDTTTIIVLSAILAVFVLTTMTLMVVYVIKRRKGTALQEVMTSVQVEDVKSANKTGSSGRFESVSNPAENIETLGLLYSSVNFQLGNISNNETAVPASEPIKSSQQRNISNKPKRENIETTPSLGSNKSFRAGSVSTTTGNTEAKIPASTERRNSKQRKTSNLTESSEAATASSEPITSSTEENTTNSTGDFETDSAVLELSRIPLQGSISKQMPKIKTATPVTGQYRNFKKGDVPKPTKAIGGTTVASKASAKFSLSKSTGNIEETVRLEAGHRYSGQGRVSLTLLRNEGGLAGDGPFF